MIFKNKILSKFWKFSTSFQLGIPVMIAIMLLTIWGTIVESRYDAMTAQKLVYQSWMMYLSMGLLVYNLTIVMIDRLPWKKNHYPFICVHIGIILLILGGYVTQKKGVDGSMSIGINSKNSSVTISQTDFSVYATFDGEKYTKIYDEEVDFFKKTPTLVKPYSLDLDFNSKKENIKVIQFVRYAQVKNQVVKSLDFNAGSSLQFQVYNANVKQVETLTQSNKNKVAEKTLGLVTFYLGYNYEVLGRKNLNINEIYFQSVDEEQVRYALFNKNEIKPKKIGIAKIGDVFQTQWMNLELRIVDFVQKAQEKYSVKSLDFPTPLTTSAVEIDFNGRKEWLVLNDTVKMFTTDVAYIVAYHNRRIPLDFEVHLDRFEIEKYQGSSKAKEYSSFVTVKKEKQNDVNWHISMNEPMKHQGYTFYQASFELDENTGEPLATVLSVNQDPGRWIKYLGSIILSFGIVWLFYQRRKRRTAL